MFCCTLLCVRSSIAIILMRKRQLVALLNLSSWRLVVVERLFLAVPQGCLRFVIVVFPDDTHLLFLRVVFVKLTLRRLKTGMSDLKNTKQLKFCLWWIFYAFLKCRIFQIFFEIFEIHQYILVKLLNALNFI